MSLYNQIRARRSLIDTVMFRALSQAATILSYIIMVRGMRKEDFGVFNLLYSFIPVVSTLASLGLEQTLRRYQPEYLHAGNVRAAGWLVRFVSAARFGTNVVIIGVLLLSWNYVAPIFHLTPYRGAFVLFSFLIVLYFQFLILQMTLASHMLHRYSVGAVVVLSVGKLVTYSALVVMSSLTLEHAILADTLAYFLAYLFVRTVYRSHCRRNDSSGPYKPSPQERRRLLSYGLFNNFNDAGSLLLDTRIDNFFIAAFIDPISVAIYSFYTRLAEMVANISPVRLFDNVIQPLFFATKKDEAARRLPQYFTLLLNLNLVPYWPFMAFSLAYHSELVAVVFGGKYIEHSWLLPLLMAFSMLNSVATPVTLIAQYEERVAIILLSKVTVLYNIAAMLILLPIAGLYGAALARGSAVALKNAFIWWHVRHRAIWGNVLPLVLTGSAIWGAVVLVCVGLKRAVSAPAVVHLGMGAVVCAVGLLVYLRSPALSRSDRALLQSLFHGKEARALQRLGILRPARGDASS